MFNYKPNTGNIWGQISLNTNNDCVHSMLADCVVDDVEL